MSIKIISQKRSPKNPIKFQLSLNDEQKEAKRLILNNAITVIKGKAGSGKTLVACQAALDMLFTRQVDNIIITRPTVSKEDIGFLPGSLMEKMDPWISPIYANMYNLYRRDKVDQIIADNSLEIVPLSFMRGRTFLNSFIIVDEAQNITHEQMEMVLSRIGLYSKMVICGDLRQNDLKNPRETGFDFLCKLKDRVDDLGMIELQKNHRHAIVNRILKEYNSVLKKS